ncbi:TPM domain-containing protein [Mycolicibacterium fluoranthenivorans]|uniref:Putative membrane protein YgcG/BMFP domain-containing protein YqiC n=1 Tax=Mycolicibacterium fluoranthenivorans TaxID=258505 RepID=A0A7X5U2K2_9MYCO|nr:TPM domain-containing protein [Mycolicibacterium fluoranthenivorans]MCV7354230.1 TPM domain-containing protein [Mycolicibacterium fluoranthenivorans]NIH97200.1 putative membrane protein YgcG/BMFP domain-containing protein YqiC [Mycolicibacterium fluoranthenivorans]
MRLPRLFSVIFAVLSVSLLVAPHAGAEPPFRLSTQIVDKANALSGQDLDRVTQAVDKLYADRHVRLWVVYVDTFSGQDAEPWARATLAASDLGTYDALLAVATTDRAYAFLAGGVAASNAEANSLRRNKIEPALRGGDWAQAAVSAAEGLDTNASAAPSSSSNTEMNWVGLLAILAVIALAVVILVLWQRHRRRKRRAADLAAAQRADPTDPNALAAMPLDTLDDLSRSIVVEVDNAVRTSDNELTLAIEEFGEKDTTPFVTAVEAAKTTLAQAFNVRQILDDTVPETPAQRRDLLTRVVVAAAKADRELETQREAFAALRDLVINAPERLDALTQQVVDLTARLAPSEQTLAGLHQQFADAALTSVAGNVETAKQRVAFADQNITNARSLVARPVGSQAGLVDSIRAAESALGQARTLLDAVDSAATDINRATAALPAAIADIQNGINAAGTQLAQGNLSQAAALSAARDAAVKAVAAAQGTGSTDPLGAFTDLSAADADLDRLLDAVTEERETAERLRRAYDQALFSAQSRVRGVSDFIDTRRGSIGPEARTKLAEAVRQLQAAQDKQAENIAGSLSVAIQYANGAASLAGQAQSLANQDVAAAQRHYSGYGGGSSNSGAVLGGIIIGNILSGALRGGIGGSVGGGWSSTSFGGSGSSGGSFGGGGGRF